MTLTEACYIFVILDFHYDSFLFLFLLLREDDCLLQCDCN